MCYSKYHFSFISETLPAINLVSRTLANMKHLDFRNTDLKHTHQTKLLCKWQKWHILVCNGSLDYFQTYFTFTTKILSLDYSHFEPIIIKLQMKKN